MGVVMESVNIALPESLMRFVEAQIATGRYSSASEYVLELIREDEKGKSAERLETLLLEGLEGEESEMTGADWKLIRKEALALIQSREKVR
jgi:antitoxin ParD1/3/4